LGVGSAERNNGILLLVALDNYYKGQPGGDYYIGWGSGRFRYLDGRQAKGAMEAIAALVKDERRKGIALALASLSQHGE